MEINIRKSPQFLLPLFFFLLAYGCSDKTQNSAVTAEDYRRAESFLWQNTSDLVLNSVSRQYWQPDGTLIYRKSIDGGDQYVLANPGNGTKKPAFDHKKLAESLAGVTAEETEATSLSISNIEIDPENSVLRYNFNSKRYETNLQDYSTQLTDQQKMSAEHLSPDGRLAAYIKDYNLWVRNTKTNERTQLTFDGAQYYGYATNNAGWITSDLPVLKWSPNSDKIATFRHDSRGVGEMYLYTTNVGHSELKRWKYPLPGDSLIFRIERVVIHLDEEPRMVKLNMPPDAHRSTIADHVADWDGEFLDVQWKEDGSRLAFVSSSRDHKEAQLKIADQNSGKVTSVLKESVDTYFESGFNEVNWRVLGQTDEVIWFSERSNWGHLYLVDLKSGEIKNPITQGDWAVLQVRKVDEANRTIYFTGSNREEGNPYYHYLYKVNFDGSGLKLLTPEPMHHQITFSGGGQYFTDIYSTPDTPAKAVIRDLEGKVVLALEEEDISSLKENGWVAPNQFTAKARDGETDLYGLMYKPTNFDASKKYPVLNYLYPGPQTGSVRTRAFRASRSDKQALAELGFIVVEVDAMGTPGRSKSFHDAYYGNMGDNGIPDQMAVIKQLANENNWMDIDRVGIWGHSGGGFASTRAILEYPDFYKVAVSGAGNHDNRNYEDDWGEKWHGLLVEYEGSADRESKGKDAPKTNYDSQANQLLAENLEGKLLIAHGMMDSNVPPTNTLLVVEALINADKDFDMLVFPNAGHGFGNSRYFMNKRWDYFVKHLKGVDPPADFVFAENIK